MHAIHGYGMQLQQRGCTEHSALVDPRLAFKHFAKVYMAATGVRHTMDTYNMINSDSTH